MNDIVRMLLVDCCYERDSLSQYEFVHPVQKALERAGFPCQISHYSMVDEKLLESCDKVILCGTALEDREYLNHLQEFAWIKDGNKPVLGICAGMQIIAVLFLGEILSRPIPAIGLERIEVAKESDLLGPCREIEVYHLHSHDVTIPDGFVCLAGGREAPEAFFHISLPVLGLMFYPEVRNTWILENYANL